METHKQKIEKLINQIDSNKELCTLCQKFKNKKHMILVSDESFLCDKHCGIPSSKKSLKT